MMSLTWNPPRLRDGWRLPLGVLFCLLLLILLAYRETGTAMVGIWMRSATFTHAFVVPPIVAWLIWRKSGELEPLQPRPQPWMLVPMAGLAVLWWLGSLVSVASVAHLAFTALLVCCVPLVLGWQVTRLILFPLGFVFFAVPIGEFLTPTLMHWTAEALVGGLRLTGIPVYQEGQQLVIPSGRWAVVEACSGIRYLMATFMVGSLFAYLNYQTTRKRVLFMVISIVMPVVANWLRAYIIVMLGHLSNNEIATGVDHLIYGWIFFGAVIMALFFVGARWADDDSSPSASPTGPDGLRLAPAASVQARHLLVPAVLAMGLVLLPPGILDRMRDVTAAAEPQVALPDVLGTWQAQAPAPDSWSPYFATATTRLSRDYVGLQGRVNLQVHYYRGQVGDVKLVSSVNRYLAPEEKRWHLLDEGLMPVITAGRSVEWRVATLLAAERPGLSSMSRPRLTVMRLYWVGGELTQNDVRAKLVQAGLALRGQPDDGAAIHLVSSLPDAAAARQQLAGFIGENFTMLERTLMSARERR